MSLGLGFGLTLGGTSGGAKFPAIGPSLDLVFGGASTSGSASSNSSIDLNFIGGSYAVGAPYLVWTGTNLQSRDFQDIVTFSRATSGTYVNSNGYITNSSVLNYLTYSNQFDNAAWTKSNSFVQTNLLPYSQDFSNAAWFTNLSTKSTNSFTATATTGTHFVYQNFTFTAAKHTLFAIVSYSNWQYVILKTYDGVADVYANFDLINGTAGATSGCVSTITPIGNGRYQITLIQNSIPATSSGNVSINFGAAAYFASPIGANPVITTTGVETINIHAAQLVQGSVPGNYQATTSTALPVLYAGPSGTLNAMKLCEGTTTSAHFAFQGGTGAGQWTLSEYFKAGERTRVALGNSFAGDYAVFDLSAGTVVSAGSGTVSGGTIVNIGSGWYRCVAVCTPVGAWNPAFVTVSTGTTTSYTGDGSSGIYIAQAQLNDGSTALSYYQTTASQYNAPRFDYDPVTLTAKGLLIEESRPNLLLQSNDFQTSWTPTNITRTLNSILSPSGNVDGVKIAATASATTLLFQSAIVAATAATGSVYVKQGTSATVGGTFTLRNNNTLTNLVQGSLNYSTGVFTYAIGSSGVVVTNVGNGWWRISMTATTGITSGDTLVWYVGWGGGAQTAGDFFYAYGAQLEPGAFATSYIPTVASQVTRAADSASVNTLTPWFSAANGTIFATGARMNTSASGSLVEFGDGTNNNRFFVYGNTSGSSGSYIVNNGGVSQASIDVSNGFVTNIVGKIAAVYAANDFQQATNATLGTADLSGTISTVTAMYIGRAGSSLGAQWNGWVQRVSYYPRRMSNADLVSLTTL